MKEKKWPKKFILCLVYTSPPHGRRGSGGWLSWAFVPNNDLLSAGKLGSLLVGFPICFLQTWSGIQSGEIWGCSGFEVEIFCIGHFYPLHGFWMTNIRWQYIVMAVKQFYEIEWKKESDIRASAINEKSVNLPLAKYLGAHIRPHNVFNRLSKILSISKEEEN